MRTDSSQFDNDDTTQLPQQPAPTQFEDKFDAIIIMLAINTRFHDIKLHNNTWFDEIIAKLDDAINNAIISKLDNVVTEVTNIVLPLIADQVTTQVSTAIDSHIAELWQKHNNMHNMDNSISTYKQQIDGELTTLRASTKSITDIQDQVNDINTQQCVIRAIELI